MDRREFIKGVIGATGVAGLIGSKLLASAKQPGRQDETSGHGPASSARAQKPHRLEPRMSPAEDPLRPDERRAA